MNSFGASLKKEREAKGISLQEISDHTKIGVRLLRALEEEQLDQLPGGIFDKSFLRQYARYLGLNEEHIVAEYQQALGTTPEPQPLLSVAHEEKSSSSAAGYPRLILTAICLGIIVAAILYGIHQYTERTATQATSTAASLPPAEPANAPPVSSYPSAVASNAPDVSSSTSAPPAAFPAGGDSSADTATNTANSAADHATAEPRPSSTAPEQAAAVSSAAEQQSAPAVPAEGLVLQIDAHKEVWLSIAADGQKQWQGTLLADANRKVQAKDSVRLTVGDASAVALTLNGKLLPSVGRAGEVKTLTISAKGVAAVPKPAPAPATDSQASSPPSAAAPSAASPTP